MKEFFKGKNKGKAPQFKLDSSYSNNLSSLQLKINENMARTSDRFSIGKHYQLYPENIIHMIKLSLAIIRAEAEDGILNRLYRMKESLIRCDTDEQFSSLIEKLNVVN